MNCLNHLFNDADENSLVCSTYLIDAIKDLLLWGEVNVLYYVETLELQLEMSLMEN
jgi:hypothetical protein